MTEIEKIANNLKKNYIIGGGIENVNGITILEDLFKEIGKVENKEWADKYKKVWKGFLKYHFYYDPVSGNCENIFSKIVFPQNFKSAYYAAKEHGYEKIFNSEPNFMFLFLCMAWKNGDLEKEESIVKGLSVEKTNEGNDCYGYPIISLEGPVFYQFGLFLQTMSNRKNKALNYTTVEPIIDQHSLRAYNFFFKNKSIGEADVKFDSKKKKRQALAL